LPLQCVDHSHIGDSRPDLANAADSTEVTSKTLDVRLQLKESYRAPINVISLAKYFTNHAIVPYRNGLLHFSSVCTVNGLLQALTLHEERLLALLIGDPCANFLSEITMGIDINLARADLLLHFCPEHIVIDFVLICTEKLHKCVYG
jgi:hypothetical protein